MKGFEVGVVWGKGESDLPPGKLRDIVQRVEVPALNQTLRQFIAWVAGYTLQPMGAVLRCAACDGVVMRAVHTPHGRWLDLAGARWLKFARSGIGHAD